MQERVKPKSKPEAASKSASKAAPTSKVKVSVEIDAKLAAAATAKGLDLASVLEQALSRSLRVAKQLTEADRDGLKALERYVSENGPGWDEAGSS